MTKKKIPDLIFEELRDSSNLYYLSLIEYKRENYLSIIDNMTENEITAYVLDFAQQENMDIKQIFSISNQWFYSNSNRYPISFEFAKLGINKKLSPIYRKFDINYISRIIGHSFCYNTESTKVKRKRAIPINESIEIKFKKT